jgi:hypothetical protein
MSIDSRLDKLERALPPDGDGNGHGGQTPTWEAWYDAWLEFLDACWDCCLSEWLASAHRKRADYVQRIAAGDDYPGVIQTMELSIPQLDKDIAILSGVSQLVAAWRADDGPAFDGAVGQFVAALAMPGGNHAIPMSVTTLDSCCNHAAVERWRSISPYWGFVAGGSVTYG